MIPQDIEQRRKIIEYMLDGLSKADIDNKWEADFIESISAQYETKKNLSDKQCEKLESIYEKVF